MWFLVALWLAYCVIPATDELLNERARRRDRDREYGIKRRRRWDWKWLWVAGVLIAVFAVCVAALDTP
jgi:hypothetical protein